LLKIWLIGIRLCKWHPYLVKYHDIRQNLSIIFLLKLEWHKKNKVIYLYFIYFSYHQLDRCTLANTTGENDQFVSQSQRRQKNPCLRVSLIHSILYLRRSKDWCKLLASFGLSGENGFHCFNAPIDHITVS